MNEMIERVAKAMFCRVSTNYNPAQHWDELVMMPAQNTVTNHYRNMADAAIKALREPTEAMLEKVYELRATGDDFLHKSVYRKMIDAILEEKA